MATQFFDFGGKVAIFGGKAADFERKILATLAASSTTAEKVLRQNDRTGPRIIAEFLVQGTFISELAWTGRDRPSSKYR